jgi:hypothetical protein
MLKFYSKNRIMPNKPASMASKLFAILGLLIITNAALAQTTILSPSTNNGGFESGTTGWTFVQATGGTTDNRWEIGSVSTPYAGSNAAYITTGATGLPWAYAHTARRSYMYQDVTFPAGETSINLSFKWKGYGESTWDNLLVYLAPTTLNPATSQIPTATSTSWTGATFLWRQGDISTSSWSITNYLNANITITGTQAGNATTNSTMRLIFVWRNDGGGTFSSSNVVGASLDDITLTSSCTGAAPTSASPVTSSSATLNWSAFTGATGYNVRYKAVGDPTTVSTWATPTSVSGGSTTSLAISSLTANTQYEYQVAAANGCTVYSTSVLFTTPCTSASLPQFEGFNTSSTTSMPSCWSTTIVTPPTNTTQPALTFETSGSNPTVSTPREGTRMIKFNSFNSNGSEIRLVSLPVSTVGAAGAEVLFSWYNDANTSYNAGNYLLEGVQVQYSTNGTTWTNTGSFVPRSNPTAGWISKTVTLPSSVANQSLLYVGFLFTSKYGNNCYMDSVYIKSIPMCSTTPTPGNTLSTASAACSGVNFTLSVQNPPSGVGGITYQWQSSTNGTSYSDILNATSPTLTTSQTAATYYQCKVICNNTSTGISTPIQITMNPFYNCYCSLTSTNCGSSDVITNVTLGTLNNSSGCTSGGYASYTSSVAAPVLVRGSSNSISVSVGPGGTEYVYTWIDWNQNGTLDASEYTYIGSGNGTTITSSISVPSTATVGTTGMRVRLRYNTTLAMRASPTAKRKTISLK